MQSCKVTTIEQVQVLYDIRLKRQSIIQAEPRPPSPAFVDNLEFDMQNVDLRSGAARQEAIIYPLLREIFRDHTEKLSLFSHRALTVDSPDKSSEDNIRLSGVPDYLVSTRSPLGRTVMGKPLLIVVATERDDFDLGWAQCLAEMVAVQMYNKSEKISVYGIVTNGGGWQFGKLAEKQLLREPGLFPIQNLDTLLGAVKFVFSEVETEGIRADNES